MCNESFTRFRGAVPAAAPCVGARAAAAGRVLDMKRKAPQPASVEAGSTARPSEAHAALALREAATVMAPLALWLLRNGVSYSAFADLLKTVFVDAARSELERNGAHPTQSALSVLSGVHRKDVRVLEGAPPKADASRLSRGVPLVSQVFTRWLTDRRYRARDGSPKPLARAGGAVSFEGLVRTLSSDVHARTVLDELLRLGLVQLDGERVIPVNTAFVPDRRLDALTSLFSANAADHLAAAVHNLTADAPRYLEQSVFADGLSADSLEELHAHARAAWARTFADMVAAATERVERDAAVPPEAQQRMRFGVYFYGESTDGTAAPPAAPRVRQARRRRTE